MIRRKSTYVLSSWPNYNSKERLQARKRLIFWIHSYQVADNQYIAAYYLYIPNTISKQLRKIKPRPLIILKIEIFTIYSEKKIKSPTATGYAGGDRNMIDRAFPKWLTSKSLWCWLEWNAGGEGNDSNDETHWRSNENAHIHTKKEETKKKRKKSRLHFHPEGMYENWWQVSIRGGRGRSSSTIISDTTNTQKPSSDTVKLIGYFKHWEVS